MLILIRDSGRNRSEDLTERKLAKPAREALLCLCPGEGKVKWQTSRTNNYDFWSCKYLRSWRKSKNLLDVRILLSDCWHLLRKQLDWNSNTSRNYSKTIDTTTKNLSKELTSFKLVKRRSEGGIEPLRRQSTTGPSTLWSLYPGPPEFIRAMWWTLDCMIKKVQIELLACQSINNWFFNLAATEKDVCSNVSFLSDSSVFFARTVISWRFYSSPTNFTPAKNGASECLMIGRWIYSGCSRPTATKLF